MRDSQCFDTDLNFNKDLIGRRRSISVTRSSLLATVSIDDDARKQEEEEVIMVLSDFVSTDIMVGNMAMENSSSVNYEEKWRFTSLYLPFILSR